jgi:hypothetical protein
MTMSFLRATVSTPATQGTELAQALRRVVGGEVRFDFYTRQLFSRDASMYTIEPLGVEIFREALQAPSSTG